MEKKERLDSQRGAGEGQRGRKERLESNIPDKETVIIRAGIMAARTVAGRHQEASLA